MTGWPVSAAVSHTFSVLTSTPATALTESRTASAACMPARVSVKKIP